MEAGKSSLLLTNETSVSNQRCSFIDKHFDRLLTANEIESLKQLRLNHEKHQTNRLYESLSHLQDSVMLPRLCSAEGIKPAQSCKNLIENYHVKQRLAKNLVRKRGNFNPYQSELFSLLAMYCDVHVNNASSREEIQNVYCLHIVDHVLKSRARVSLNTNRLKKLAEFGTKGSRF